jgi:hypothetical protein
MQHKSLMLDIYKWLALGLCRVPPKHPAFVVWPLVEAQSGSSYKRIRDFRHAFLKALKVVLTQYPGDKVDASEHGVKLYRKAWPLMSRLTLTPQAGLDREHQEHHKRLDFCNLSSYTTRK